jgi:CDK inhibitor PHO81
MVPALIEAIKAQGLVLVIDKTAEAHTTGAAASPLPEGIDGVLKSNGVLRFNESIDM